MNELAKAIAAKVKSSRKEAGFIETFTVKDKIVAEGLDAALEGFKQKHWDGESELVRLADYVNGTWSDEDLVAYLSVKTDADLAANLSDRQILKLSISRPSWLGFCASSLLGRIFLSYARGRLRIEEDLKREVEAREEGSAPYAGESTSFNKDQVLEALEAMEEVKESLSTVHAVCSELAAEPLRPISLSYSEPTLDIDRAFQLYSVFVAEYKAAAKEEYIKGMKNLNKAALNGSSSDEAAKEALRKAGEAAMKRMEEKRDIQRSLKEGKIPEKGEFIQQTAIPSDELEEFMMSNGIM